MPILRRSSGQTKRSGPGEIAAGPMGGDRSGFRRMVGLSLAFHLTLAALFLWQLNLRVYQKVSFAVMEVRMVSLPETPKEAPVPPAPPPVTRKGTKPAKSAGPPIQVRPLPKEEPPKGETVHEPAEEPRPATPDEAVSERPAEEPVVAVDIRNFKYDYYLRLIQAKVERQWRQPVSGKERKAVIGFTISRKGKVERASIEESSGDDYFDQTALRAVRFADPFPPLPQGYLGESLQVHYRFQFGDNG